MLFFCKLFKYCANINVQMLVSIYPSCILFSYTTLAVAVAIAIILFYYKIHNPSCSLPYLFMSSRFAYYFVHRTTIDVAFSQTFAFTFLLLFSIYSNKKILYKIEKWRLVYDFLNKLSTWWCILTNVPVYTLYIWVHSTNRMYLSLPRYMYNTK